MKETNAIGTAYLRIGLLPAQAQLALRDDFRSYVDARIDFYRNITPDPAAIKRNMEGYSSLQNKIWSEALAACQEAGSPATTSLVASSLNEMFDVTTTRLAALETHPPTVVFVGLTLLMLASARLAGYGMAEAKKPSRFHMLIFPLILATAVFVIVDFEFPRIGLVRIDKADHFLTDLRTTMKERCSSVDQNSVRPAGPRILPRIIQMLEAPDWTIWEAYTGQAHLATPVGTSSARPSDPSRPCLPVALPTRTVLRS